jgi:putative SOS response-associated peptidase YedK
MTFRYRLMAPSPAIAAALDAHMGPDPWNGGEAGVGQFAPVITRGGRGGERVIRPMHWGYPPPGQPAEAMGLGPPRWVPAVRNLESPYWIGNLRHTELRCLIPATAFECGTGAERRWYGVRDEPVFAIAGIWRDLTDMPVFAMLTTDPASALLPVEGKGAPSSMPVILRAADQDRWLHDDWKTAKALARPLASAAIVEAAG